MLRFSTLRQRKIHDNLLVENEDVNCPGQDSIPSTTMQCNAMRILVFCTVNMG